MKNNLLQSFIDGNTAAGLQANILIQSDTKFIGEAVAAISELRALKEANKFLKDTTGLLKDTPNGLEIIKRLEDILTKRFIINSKAYFKINGDNAQNAFAVTALPDSARSIITGNEASVKDTYSPVIKILEKFESRDNNGTVGTDDLDQMLNLMRKNVKDADSLEKSLKIKEVTFDLKNATVSNLPDDFSFLISVDFFYFLEQFTDAEILVIMLHEIGHCYTILLNTYRQARTNSLLRELTSLADKTAPEKIILTMAEDFNVPAPKVNNNTSDKNRSKEMTMFVASILENIAYGKSKFTKETAEAEVLADQFASRFGLEKEMFNVSKKLATWTSYSEGDIILSLPNFIEELKMSSVFSAICLIIYLITAAHEAMVIGVILIAGAFFKLFIYGLIRFFHGTDDAMATTYDDKKRRMGKIRNDLVRRLNSIEPIDAVAKGILKTAMLDLQNMDNDLDKMPRDLSVIGMAGEAFLPWLRKKSKETFITEMLEDMEANKLKLLSEKIKQSGGL